MVTVRSIPYDIHHLFTLWRQGQIRIPVFGYQYIVFDSNSSNMHVPLQYLLVDEFRDFWVG